MTRRRGSRGGRKVSQKEGSDGQRSTKEPRCAQDQPQSSSHRVSLPPRPPPAHDSHQDKQQGADRRTHVPSPIMQNQLNDPWAGRGYIEYPMDESRVVNPRGPPVGNQQVHPHEFYRQRTPPDYRRHQHSEIAPMRPSFEGRGPPSSRMTSAVQRQRSRSMSPVAGSTRSSGNPALAAASVSSSAAAATRAGESNPDHIGGENKNEAQQNKCGNCKREGHEVKDCVSKIGATGYVMACPRCNTNKHLYERCPSPHAPAVGTRQREEDDLYYLLTCRQNKPQIRAWTDLVALVRWTTPSLAAFPWTPAFALRHHEDPIQAAAERDYDYDKHDFGPRGGGRRPDREALTRRFDPSHPAIPKIPEPTMLIVPATPQEIESHQRTVAHNSTALVDTVMSDINARAEAMGANSGVDGAVTVQQRAASPFGSYGPTKTHTWNSTPTTVSPLNRGGHSNNSWAAPAPTPTGKDEGEINGNLGTKGVGASSKGAPTKTKYGAYAGTWEAYVAAEIERIERRKSLKKEKSKH